MWRDTLGKTLIVIYDYHSSGRMTKLYVGIPYFKL